MGFDEQTKREVVISYRAGLSVRECAKKYNTTKGYIDPFLRKIGILRSCKEGLRLSYLNGKRSLKNHPKWKGGRRIERGYVVVNFGTINGKHNVQFEHRLIVEKVLGRKLKKGEVVHHINGDKSDNRNCNLLVCSAGYHNALSHKMAILDQQEHFK